MVRGRWPEPFAGEAVPPGFFASYEVVAETPDEALKFILPFEPEVVRGTLVLEDCEVGESAANEPKGVYGAPGGYTLFPWEEAD